ncbi:uncharacterized protein LOC106178723 [Lingula anatina]|uniref:Uncharacterized protein LOC106178723 n=1 Tax=Lingula anatina TaxID=7574 RepID=A0A1S3K4C0_LINAN|nr:uncharacterized protein LOC106178723 [Lingula anatina]|eukprot:XP_013417475.1 uncharacterized protein LOC106178723 [Lingula anatina]
MFYSALRYLYRIGSRHNYVGNTAKRFAEPSRCCACAVTQLQNPQKMCRGWSLERNIVRTKRPYSTKITQADLHFIRTLQRSFEKNQWDLEGRSVAEIIRDYENEGSADSLDGVLRYMWAVCCLLKEPPTSHLNGHLLQDERLSSALQTILNKGLMKESNPKTLSRLLLFGGIIRPTSEVLHFYAEVEKCSSQLWPQWDLYSKTHFSFWCIYLSAIHKQKYFEEEIRYFLKNIVSELMEEPDDGIFLRLFEVAVRVSHEQGGKWVDVKDVTLCLPKLELWYFYNENIAVQLKPNFIFAYVQLCFKVQHLVSKDISRKILKILQKSLLSDEPEEEKIKALESVQWILKLISFQKLKEHYMQYVTELAELFKKHASLLPLKQQVAILSSFASKKMCYSDHEMLLKVVENFMANSHDIGEVRHLVDAHLQMDCKPSIAFLTKISDLMQNQGENAASFQLISIACHLMGHGYQEDFSGILDCCLGSNLMKEIDSVNEGKGHVDRMRHLVKLCGRLEVAKIDKYVKQIPPTLYKLHSIQDQADCLNEICQKLGFQGLLAAVRMILGGPHTARIMPVLAISYPVVEFCLNEFNEPVDVKQVPRAFDQTGLLKMENMSALPEGWSRVAVWLLRHYHVCFNKPDLNGETKAALLYLKLAGYNHTVVVKDLWRKGNSSYHSHVRSELNKIHGIRLPRS